MSDWTCYGNYNKKRNACQKCEYAEFCQDAANLELSKIVSFDNISYSEDFASPIDTIDMIEPDLERPQYTRSHLLELVNCLLDIDDNDIRHILRLKIHNPDISYSKIGKHWNITKQAVHAKVNSAIKKWPQLKSILQNRPMFNRNNRRKKSH